MAIRYLSYFGKDRQLVGNSLTTSLNGVLYIGTSASRHALGATADREGVRFNFASTATTGCNRGLDTRLTLSSGAGGEAGRFFTTVANNAPADTVNGAHISLEFGSAAGNVTGLGSAVRCTLHVPSRALTGTTGAVIGELWANGAGSTGLGGNLSFFRARLGGNATGLALLDDTAYFMTLDGGSTASGNICHTNTAADATHGLRCLINGVSYDILMKSN